MPDRQHRTNVNVSHGYTVLAHNIGMTSVSVVYRVHPYRAAPKTTHVKETADTHEQSDIWVKSIL